MTRRRRRLLPFALVLLALVVVACGGGGAPPPAPTATATAAPPPPSATWTPPIATPTPEAQPVAEFDCLDPYPGGAPFEPTPGAPIRLRPAGAPPPLPSYQPLPLIRDPALERVIRRSLGDEDGRFAVVVKNLDDSRGVALAAGRRFYAASLFKVWVMLEAYHQREGGLLDLEERYLVSDYYEQLGLNPEELAACDEVSVAEALQAMMGVSDNVAANLLLDRVGAANVNDALRGLGLSVSGFFGDDSLPTTAADTALLLEAIARRQAVSAAASDEMLELLESETVNDRLPALLPKGTRLAHKTGSWTNATHDAGIVYSPGATYLIVVLTDFDFRKEGASQIADLSRAVYDYYNEG